jgi:hypothetical protein
LRFLYPQVFIEFEPLFPPVRAETKSYSLGQYTTVFQAEVYAIKTYAVENLDRNYKNINICILSVSLQLKHLANTR